MIKETTSYRNCRVLIQLFTLIGILINLLVIAINIYNYKILKVESSLMSEYWITHTDIGLLFIGINLVVLIFANCGITSSYKTVMKIYCKISKWYSYLMTIFSIYFSTFYMIEFRSLAGSAIKSNSSISGLISAMFIGLPASVAINSTIKIFSFVLYSTIFSNAITILINFLTIGIMKIALNSQLLIPPPELPEISLTNQVGMTTNSLKKKRIISLDNSFIYSNE